MTMPQRVQVLFKKAAQVGVSWYGAGSLAAFPEKTADQLVREGIAERQGFVDKQVSTAPKGQAQDRQVTSEAPTPQSENKMVSADERPTIGTRVKRS